MINANKTADQYCDLADLIQSCLRTPFAHIALTDEALDDGPMCVLAHQVIDTQDRLAIRDLNHTRSKLGRTVETGQELRAFLGLPIVDQSGQVRGSVCVADVVVREWSESDSRILSGFIQPILTGINADDLTAKLAQVEAQHTEDVRYYAKALEVAGTGLWTWDRSAGTRWAPEACALFGFSQDDYPETIESFLTFVRESDRHRLLEAIESVNPSAPNYDVELRVKGPLSDGYRWMRTRGRAGFDEHHQLQHIAGVLTDVDALIGVQRASQTVDERLHRIANQSTTAYAEWDTDINLIFANNAYAELHEKDVGELVGQHASTVLGEYTWPLVEAYMKDAAQGLPYEYTIDLTGDQSNPDARCLHVTYTPHLNESGLVTSFSSALADITDQQSQTLRAEKLDERLKIANQMSPDGFIIINASRDSDMHTHPDSGGYRIKDFIIEYCNQAGAEMMGRDPEEITGAKLLEIWPDTIDAGFFDAFAQVVGTAEPFETEYRHTQGGVDLWVEVCAIKLTDGCAVSLHNCTERKNAELHRTLLVNELNHRVKNSLATIQAIARHTVRSAEDFGAFERTFTARLSAIAAAHDIVMQSDQGRTSLATMINKQLSPYMDNVGQQLRVSGNDVMLSGPCAHAIGLILHELATNAAKYGSLSVKSGHVEISWVREESNRVGLKWLEIGGPTVSTPKNTGFGTLLIKQSLGYALGGSANLNYAPTGLQAELLVPIE